MSLQYITDNKGKTTGVYIPIEDWNDLLKKHKKLREESEKAEIPEWHHKIVGERKTEYLRNPDEGLDFDNALDELEKEQ